MRRHASTLRLKSHGFRACGAHGGQGCPRSRQRTARREEAQAAAALAAARDNAVAQEWAFHNLMLGVKDQVMAQFGRDSNEVQALGLKKASERKSPQRRSKEAQG